MRLLILAPSFAPAVRAGGPARVLTNLVDASSADHEIHVVTPDRDLGDETPFPTVGGRTVDRAGAKVTYLDVNSPRQIASVLIDLARSRFDLIILNSVWNVQFSICPLLLHCLGVIRGPLLLMPRGELEVGALSLKAGKKRLFGTILRRLYSSRVTLFGGTSQSETENIEKFFRTSSVIYSANDHPDEVEFSSGENRSDSVAFTLLFLGRVHPTKGLLELLNALKFTRESIHLLIAGPVEDADYWRHCERTISELPSSVTVEVLGLVGRDEVSELLRRADMLGMLTAGENYGHVVAEALQAGCPVLITRETPWTKFIESGGGVVVDRQQSAKIAVMLDAWSQMDKAERIRRRMDALEAFNLSSTHLAPSIIEVACDHLAPR